MPASLLPAFGSLCPIFYSEAYLISEKTRENPFADPIHPLQILHVGIYESRTRFVSTDPEAVATHFLILLPSIFAQALRAAIVPAELPLRGKLRAKATILIIQQRILEVVYQCLQAPFVQGLILCYQTRIGPCSARGQNFTPGCVCPTSNPAVRAARAVPRPTNFSKRGAPDSY